MWPENWQAFAVFEALCTQWRTGFNGATGLDYSAAYPLIDRSTDDKADWLTLFNDLRVLESAALNTMANNRPKK